ncbi:MAG TPA: hypothetical protein VLI71_00355 [Gammaproteobacteria bacterium]|nr:hypothetical protein [Gammaproteobacteria bacterium]
MAGHNERSGGWSRRVFSIVVALLIVSDSPEAQGDLFDDAEPLAITLSFDFNTLCRAGAEVDCPDTPGALTYVDRDGADRAVPVWIRARGRWRNVSANCSMPPLSVIFGDRTEGTVFAGQSMLPLTTHCNEWPAAQEQYVLKELVAYGIYNELTDKSFRVRLARVRFELAGRRPRTVERYAFFTEHFDSLAARNGAQFWPTENFDPRTGDAAQLATVELFEFMIGNTDWSLVRGHNIAHLRDADNTVAAVPYDFDFSGIVNASYATPQLRNVRRVTQRVYRGFCHAGLDWEALFRRFESEREPIAALIDRTPALDEAERSRIRAYVASFYEIIGSPERRQDYIVEECRPLADGS